MCNDVSLYNDNVEGLEDFFEFVNTDLYRELRYNIELYAAYATLHGLSIYHIRGWWDKAERDYTSEHLVEQLLLRRNDNYPGLDINDLVQLEIDEGRLLECGGYWFNNE